MLENDVRAGAGGPRVRYSVKMVLIQTVYVQIAERMSVNSTNNRQNTRIAHRMSVPAIHEATFNKTNLSQCITTNATYHYTPQQPRAHEFCMIFRIETVVTVPYTRILYEFSYEIRGIVPGHVHDV